MHQKFTWLYRLVLIAALLAGCAPATPAAQAPQATATLAQAPQATVASSPEASVAPTTEAPVEPQPTAASPQPTEAPTSAAQPAGGGEDLSIFKAGLIQGEQANLAQLEGATVYHVELQIADTLSSVEGKQQVDYTNRESQALDSIYFQLFPNMLGGGSGVYDVTVDGQAVEPKYAEGNTAVQLPLASPLEPGKSVTIQMAFKVEVPTSAGGNYGLFGYINDILVLDGLLPVIPVYDEKGWHAGPVPPNADTTFNDASFYVVQVTAPAALTLVASGIETGRQTQDQNQVVTFAAGPGRDFYLAGSDQFVVVSQKVGETTVNSYAFKDRSDGAKLALETAAKALEELSKRFDPYPYTEFDVVSTPMQGATGVEYPGIVGINYEIYDTKAMIGSTPAPVLMESTVAHEAGHQWFYNMVGNDQANEPWLDEAITQYVTGLYYLDRYGQPGMDGYASSWMGRWERVDKEMKPIGLPAGDYQGREYGSIVYGRGPLFIQALAEKMGQSVFDQFLKDYVHANHWGIGTAAGFKQMAESHCGCDLSDLWTQWVSP